MTVSSSIGVSVVGARCVATRLVIASILAAPIPAVSQETGARPGEPTPQMEERVRVRLAEVEILVTDKKGNPIENLRPEELQVREKGERREVAYLEAFDTADLAARPTPQPMPLFRGLDEERAAPDPSDDLVIPAPPPQHRITLLFDAYNSRTPDRRRWIDAARLWVENEMRPEDRVSLAVVERAEIRVIVPFTAEKGELLTHLGNPSMVAGPVYHDYMLEMRTLMDDLQTCVPAYEPDMCSLSAVQSYLHDWRVRTEQTIRAVQHFTALLAAIPGRKIVFYMSDGWVVNPGEVATSAVLATFGTDLMAFNRTSAAFATDLYFDVLESLRVAGLADVTYFTFDTRHSSMRDVTGTAEERVMRHERQVSDPYAMIFDETRGALDTIAFQTGGRSYNGPNIEENLPRAIRAMSGLYTLGYYRDPRITSRPKIKVNVNRKGARVTYPNRAEENHRPPAGMRLELGMARPTPHAEGMMIPLILQVPLEEITFVQDKGEFVADVALYAEAIRPSGERAADVFQVVQVRLSSKKHDDRAGKQFSHTLGLPLAAGPYRFRVRVSEAQFERAAERTIDVTVAPDGILSTGISLARDAEPAEK